MTAHRPELTKGGKYICTICKVRYPCLEAHQWVLSERRGSSTTSPQETTPS